MLQNFIQETKTQNQEIQVFIIKQFERSDKEVFEEKYKNYINGKNIFLSNTFASTVDNLVTTSGRKNYLIPLIYDKSKKDDIILKQAKLNGDLYYYSDKYIEGSSEVEIFTIDNGSKTYYKNKITDYYYFNKYSFLLQCPLIDYTKLSYVYQIKNSNILGIGNVLAVNTQFNINSSSNCTITFACGDNDEINKDMFETNDIVIVKMLKNKNDINLIKNMTNTNIFEQEFNLYQNIFTGYIDNVNYTINFGSQSKTLNLVCSGPTKKMLFTRIISGQATADTEDITATLNPISVYSFVQTRGTNNEVQIDNETIIKNIVIRTLCDMDVIPEVKENKLNVEYYFNKNAIAITKDEQTYKDLHKYKNKYNAAIDDNLRKFYIEKSDDNDNKLYIEISNNQITNNKYNTYIKSDVAINENNVEISDNINAGQEISNQQLPIMLIKGTNQPAYQMTFDSLQNTFITQYDTLFQFIRKIANTLDFCFYDDPDGIIHFETYNTSLNHLYNLNNANYLDNIISFTENQNTNEIYNIVLASSLPTIQGLQDTAQYGIYSLVRDNNLIKKMGERFLNAGTITGLQKSIDKLENNANINVINEIYKKPLNTYAQCLMQRINNKAMSQINVQLTGNPLITMGKYAYIKQLKKLFYIDSIRQTWAASGFYTIDLTGIYTREIICSIGDINNGTYNFTSFTIPNSRKNATNAKFLYMQQKLNNKLNEEAQHGNIVRTIEELFAKDEIYNEIKKRLQNKFNMDDENFIDLLYKKNNNYAFTYLDGYFWYIPIQNDAYNLAIEQYNIDNNIDRIKNVISSPNLRSILDL